MAPNLTELELDRAHSTVVAIDRPIRVEVRNESVGANLILAVDGELDLGSVAVLVQQIDAQIGRGAP